MGGWVAAADSVASQGWGVGSMEPLWTKPRRGQTSSHLHELIHVKMCRSSTFW